MGSPWGPRKWWSWGLCVCVAPRLMDSLRVAQFDLLRKGPFPPTAITCRFIHFIRYHAEEEQHRPAFFPVVKLVAGYVSS